MDKNVFTSLKINPHFPQIRTKANVFEREIKDIFINMESLIQNTLPNSEERKAVLDSFKVERKKNLTVKGNSKYRRVTTNFIPMMNEKLVDRNLQRKPTQLKVKQIVSQLGNTKDGVFSLLKDKSLEASKFMSEKSRNILKQSSTTKIASFDVTCREYKEEGVIFKLIDKIDLKSKIPSTIKENSQDLVFSNTESNFKIDKTKTPKIDPRISIYSKFNEVPTPLTDTKLNTSYKTMYSKNSQSKSKKLIKLQNFLHGNVWQSFDNMDKDMKRMEETLEIQRNMTNKLLKRDTNNFKILSPPEYEIMREDIMNTNDKFGYLYWDGKGEYSKSNSKKEPDFKLDLEKFEFSKGNRNLDMLSKFRKMNQDRDNNVFVYYQGKPLTREEETVKERIEMYTRNKGLNSVRSKSDKLKCLLNEFNFRNVQKGL